MEKFLGRFKKITIVILIFDFICTVLFVLFLIINDKEMDISVSDMLVYIVALFSVAAVAILLTVFRKKLFKKYDLSYIDLIIPASALNYSIAIILSYILFYH